MKSKKPAQGDRYRRGRKVLAKIHGKRGTDAIDSMADVAPDLCRFVYEFPFGDIYSRPGLDLKSRQLVTISALAALGTAGPQLKSHIHGSLNVGLTREEIVEALTQLAVYAGFPAALNALKIARDVFRERDVKSAKG
jgi:4-carboxymuconolactone decarboxylase